MSNIDKQALTDESARESGKILLIVAARMARGELFTPLRYVSELPQKAVGMRTFRDALERSEEILLREVHKIVDGHDRMAKKLKETEEKLEDAEKLIAELSRHLQCAHAFVEHTEAFGQTASNGILCCGDAQWNIDASKLVLAAAGKGE